jgi:DNA polymerase-3 subunit beta
VIDGTFPDYTRVIPTDSDKTARLDATDLRASIDRVVAVSSERTSAVKLAFSQDALTVSHASATGSAQDTTGAAYDGPAFEIGINGKYVLELLGQVTGDAVLHMSDAGAPVVVLDTDDTGLLMVVMPMRVV